MQPSRESCENHCLFLLGRTSFEINTIHQVDAGNQGEGAAPFVGVSVRGEVWVNLLFFRVTK